VVVLPLAPGDELRFDGASGTVVAVTATTNGSGRGSITFEGATARFRVLRAPAKGDLEFPYVAANDPHFRVGLLRRSDDHALFCLVFDDLPAPLGWGRWVQQAHWMTVEELSDEDSVVFLVGWRPSTVLIRKGGEAQAGVYADIVLRYATSDGAHEAWFQPAYPYNDLEVDEQGVPLRGPRKLGSFRTNDQGELRRMRPDGTLEEIILPRGAGALGNREQDRWADGPVPERFLTSAEVWYLQEHTEIAEAASAALDVGAVTLTISGPPGAAYDIGWEDGWRHLWGGLDGSGTATINDLVPGRIWVALYHPSDQDKGLAGEDRKEIDCADSGGSYTLDFPTSWTSVPADKWQGRVYAYGVTPAAGAKIMQAEEGPPGDWRWVEIATTDENGDFGPIDKPGGPLFAVIVHDQWGACAVDLGRVGSTLWWVPCLGGRLATSVSWIDFDEPGWEEGLLPWGTAGEHVNLLPLNRMGYMQREDTGERYDLERITYGMRTEPVPRMKVTLGGNPGPSFESITYGIYEADGTFLTNANFGSSATPTWVSSWGLAEEQTSTGLVARAVLGGKYGGSVVEADRNREIEAADRPEAARLGLEFGKWSVPLEHRSVSESLREWCEEHGTAYIAPMTFGDWECPYCGGPVWVGPGDPTYERGFCVQCADFAVSTDCRSAFVTSTVPAFSDWRDRAVKTLPNGQFRDRLVPGWPRPEEYDENDGYLVWDWMGFGIPRWVAQHIVLGEWANGVFTDGESIADVESRLNRAVGPVQLKLLLTADYLGAGQTLRVACATPGGETEWRMVTIPVGARSGDLFPLNWYPHDAYPKGYYVDVTAVERLAGDGAVYAQIVNDGPAWHSSVGVQVRHYTHSPYACDVSLPVRDPFLVEDFAGRLHLVYLRDGRIMHRTREGTSAPWSAPTDITSRANWPHSCREPSLAPLPHATLVASAHTQGATRLFRSNDDSDHWE
jgi:hypothetical protein